MRLDKFIGQNTHFSRAEVRKLLKAGRIQVNDAPPERHDTKIATSVDIVFIDGQAVRPIGKIYLMLHKPSGYICANHDANQPVVIDLIRGANESKGLQALPMNYDELQICGRLDIDTTGLVLLTNDGEWNHIVTAPSSLCKKTYVVSLKHPIAANSAKQFAQGLQLEGEKKVTRPALLDVIGEKKVRLSISEGKYHQVKRMFAATGNRVVELHRESIGSIVLDKNLPPGQYRSLTPEEVSSIAARRPLI